MDKRTSELIIPVIDCESDRIITLQNGRLISTEENPDVGAEKRAKAFLSRMGLRRVKALGPIANEENVDVYALYLPVGEKLEQLPRTPVMVLSQWGIDQYFKSQKHQNSLDFQLVETALQKLHHPLVSTRIA
ncbi:MAG: hypothetical protein JWN33_462 [Candidatus Saccharibacteria bacterium]|nr:hypothetical protein [Candidatus Saccharibacteria bacterium]